MGYYIACKFIGKFIYENTEEMINIQNKNKEKKLDNFKNHENKSKYFKYFRR